MSWWSRIPLAVRAIVSGLAIGLIGANVWSVLLALFGPVPGVLLAEAVFLVLYIAWARGLGPPASTQSARRTAVRAGPLAPAVWAWGALAALAFAVTVHAAIVILFRLTPFPAAQFNKGYDLSAIPTLGLRWGVVMVSAISAGVCEEVGFRGYMQRPLEARYGPTLAIGVSAVLFTLVHMNKDWLVVGLMPIVLMAGLLLGLMAWAARSLAFAIFGHVLMDIGLFAYWWTQIVGVFSAKTIFAGGVDAPFFLAVAVFAAALAVNLFAIARLRRLRASPEGDFGVIV